MTKKLFAAMAMATSVFLTGAMVAEAADVKFGGQIRLRGEAWSGTGGTDLFLNENWNSFIGNRVRLNANVKVDDDLSAFIQMQSNTRFGSSFNGGCKDSNSGASCGALAGAVGPITFPSAQAGHNPQDANDDANDVGLHQAYFTQKNLFGTGVAIKGGRQEIVLDGHRLFGHTGWTTGAQSHDAVKFSHSHDNMTLAFFFSKAAENAGKSDGGNFAGSSADDSLDRDVYILWGNMKGLIGDKSSTSVYAVLDDNDTGGGLNADYWTFGVRQAGSAAGLDYRVEAYFQQGKSGNADLTAPGEVEDRSGYMFGGRIGKKFGNVMWKPKFTLWGDYLSGTEPADAALGENNSFGTLFDTGHKFYGFMDFFLGMGSANTGVNGRGLIDLAGKLAISPMAKTTVKIDYHHFQSAEDATVDGPTTLGQELDITVVYKYSANMKMVAGYSRFFARELFASDGSLTAVDFANAYDDAQWAYLMLDMKF